MMQLPQDPDFIGTWQQPALLIASNQGHLDVVRLLLEAGSDKNLADDHGATALIVASNQGHIDVVRLLLEAGADKNLANNGGRTALTLASASAHDDIAQLLLEAGADKKLGRQQRRNSFDGRIRHRTYRRRELAVGGWWLLLQAGAELNLADNNGLTALKAAICVWKL